MAGGFFRFRIAQRSNPFVDERDAFGVVASAAD